MPYDNPSIFSFPLLQEDQLIEDVSMTFKSSAKKRKIIVVKLGTSVLTGGTESLDQAQMIELVRQCAEITKRGLGVVIVSSGAMAAGREHLDFPHLPPLMSSKQLLAAVGQSRLMHIWETLFAIYKLKIGQMLLTRADLEDRERFLNARDTISALLDHGIIPIINENDAVATSEIKVGDNDNLSVLVAILCGADRLLLLTDQEGLYTADPRQNPNAQLIHEVKTINDDLRKLAGGSGSNLGTGGMYTKVQAADIARQAGIELIIAAGRSTDVIIKTMDNVRVGTKFIPLETSLESRKMWLLSAPVPQGDLFVYKRAAQALTEQGGSLLAKGIIKIGVQQFVRGDLVMVYDEDGCFIARGLVAYSSCDLQKLIGKHSKEIDGVLSYDYGAEVIHRDNMVIIQK